MGPQTPSRAGARSRVASRLALGLAGLAAVLLITGCSAEGKDEVQRLAMPAPRTVETQSIYDLWTWAWLAAAIVGVLVWGLILYVAVRYRRRSDDEIPVQTRYNLPIEVFYTIVPVIIVIVFFKFTLTAQEEVLPSDAKTGTPDATIKVVGQRWSWTFNYEDAVGGKTVHEDVGTTNDAPTLWLPVDKLVRFNLHSPDVIHSFWVPSFLFKMDVVPGRDNHFSLTPNREGDYVGKCAELCGTYHSRMIFNVKVVSESDYQAHLEQLLQRGNVGEVDGANYTNVQPGLEPGDGGSE